MARRRDDLYAAHAALAKDVLMVTGSAAPRSSGCWLWARRNESADRAYQTLTEIWESDVFTVAMLSVAVRAIRTLVSAVWLRPTDRGLGRLAAAYSGWARCPAESLAPHQSGNLTPF
jgi:glutamate dehydrogenase